MVVAGWMVVRQWNRRGEPGELGFFYDVSARRLFTADRNAPPPIRGVDGPEEDAFRAVVISTTGRADDRNSRQVAYLEKFTPELRQRMLAAQESGTALEMGRLETQNHRFVRRLEDADWVPVSSPEAEAVLGSWARPGPDGVTPVLCVP